MAKVLSGNLTEDQVPKVNNIGMRKHPDYDAKRKIWDFLMASYRGGMGMKGRSGQNVETMAALRPSGYFPGLFKGRRENIDDYCIRVAETPYFPYARNIVNAYVNYVTKSDPTRSDSNLPTDFIDDVDRHGTTMKSFVRMVLRMTKVLGEMNVMVDMPNNGDFVNLAQEIEAGQRPYVVALFPQDIVDWSFDGNGEYEWILIEIKTFRNTIEMENGKYVSRRFYWDKDSWQVWEATGDVASKNSYKFVNGGVNKIKRVPVNHIVADNIDFREDTQESWFWDLADMNRSIYGDFSKIKSNIRVQGHGILILPESQAKNKDNAIISSNAEALSETQEEVGTTRFISPEHSIYVAAAANIEYVKREMYRVSGMALRKETAAAETAAAKEWDHQEMLQFLAVFAECAETIEQGIYKLYGLWTSGAELIIDVAYPQNYAVTDLKELVEAILDLKVLGWTSDTGRKEAIKRLYAAITDEFSTEEAKAIITKEVDESIEEVDPLLALSNNEE